ncbi:MAG: hypothetical protein ACRD93_09830 [Nitrososphaeraceae archaeon]|jgi:hypothetical protein
MKIYLSFVFNSITNTDTIETVNNPFENQSEILGLSKRTSKAGKKATAKRRKERNRPHHYKDPEIDSLLRIYGDHFP